MGSVAGHGDVSVLAGSKSNGEERKVLSDRRETARRRSPDAIIAGTTGDGIGMYDNAVERIDTTRRVISSCC